MLRIVFQDLPCSNGFKNLIEHDVIFSHFLLSMLGDANVLYVSLSTYLLQHDLWSSDIYLTRHLFTPFT